MFKKSGTYYRATIAAVSTLALCLSPVLVPASAVEQAKEESFKDIQSKVDYQVDPTSPIGNHRFIVHLKEDEMQRTSAAERASAFSQAAEKVDEELKAEEPGLGFNNIVLVTTDRDLTAAESKEFMEALASDPQVERVESDRWIEPMSVPNDEKYPQQWSLHDVEYEPIDGTWSSDFDEAWDLGYDGSGQTIAIVDTGIVSHPDLDQKVLPGWDMISDPRLARDNDGRDADPTDEGMWRSGTEGCGAQIDSSWHGTHVAGIAAADTNNSEGVAGAAPGAKLLPLRVMGACGGTAMDFAAAIVWAAGGQVDGVPKNENPAGIINMSLGTQSRCNATFSDAVAEARKLGSILVAAAGNSNKGADWTAPGNCEDLITVGATGPSGKRASYSNYGPGVELAAPGGDNWAVDWRDERGWTINPIDEWEIISTVDKGLQGSQGPGYAIQEGTSQATPLVAGAVALARQANPEITQEEVLAALQKSATPFSEKDPNKPIGAGILNAANFLKEITGNATPPTDAAPTTTSDSSEPVPEPTETATPVTVTATSTTEVTETVTEVETSTVSSTRTTFSTADPITVTESTVVTPEPTVVTSTTTVEGPAPTVGQTETVTTTLPGTTVVEQPETVTTVETSAKDRTTTTETATVETTSTIVPEPATSTVTQPAAEPSTVTKTAPVKTAPQVTTTVTPPVVTLEPVTTVKAEPSTTTEVVTETSYPAQDSSVVTTTEVATHTTTATQTSTSVVNSEAEEVPVVTETVTLAPKEKDEAGEFELRWGGFNNNLSSVNSKLLVGGLAALLLPAFALPALTSLTKFFEGLNLRWNWKNVSSGKIFPWLFNKHERD